jgi:stearoyl-CoA desaturase (Delta-9 desaturase)
MITYLIILFVLISINNLTLTLYLHRTLTHRSIRLNFIIEHFFRLSLWMMYTYTPKYWIAIHRYHHHTSDRPKDPHSPVNYPGFWRLIIDGSSKHTNRQLKTTLLYTINRYSKDFQNSKLEEFYLKTPILGKVMLLVLLLFLCDIWWGLIIWVILISWMHIMFERLHPAIGHYFGYKNYKTNDNSKNILPWAIILLGEELHNNHHARPNSWSMRTKWFEVDPTAIIIQILIWCKLAYPN